MQINPEETYGQAAERHIAEAKAARLEIQTSGSKMTNEQAAAIQAGAESEVYLQVSADADAVFASLGDPNRVEYFVDGQLPSYGSGGGGFGTRTGYLAFTPDGRAAVSQALATQVRSRGVHVDAKSLLPSGETAAAIPLVPADPIKLGAVPPSLLAVLPTVRITGNQFEYLRQSVRTNNAAPVALGAVKPTSVFSLTRVNGVLQVVAHLSEPVDRYVIEDYASLTRFLSGELVAGIERAVEGQVLTGTGVAPNLLGITIASGIQVQAAIATDPLGTIRTAITSLQTAGFGNDAIILMSPGDWQTVEMLRSSTSGNLEVLGGSPIDPATRRLFGVPIILVLGLPAKQAVVMDRSAVTVYTDNKGIRVDWSTPGDTFTRNQLVARCEARFAVAVTQPLGVVKVTLPA